MSRNGKIILGVLAGVLVLCLCVAVGGFALFGAVTKSVVNNTATGPEEAAQVGQKIANYEPAGRLARTVRYAPPGFLGGRDPGR